MRTIHVFTIYFGVILVAVTGLVQDQTGAVLPAAAVDLATVGGRVVQSTTTDTAGAFHFDHVSARSRHVARSGLTAD
jgi:hypothetical protein